jgi:hypothetical protein
MGIEDILNALKVIGELILAFIAGIGGFLVSKQISHSTIKKQDSEATSEITSAAIELVKPLREELKQIRAELRKTNARLKVMEDGVCILIQQLERLDIVPDWIPPVTEDENKNEEKGNTRPNSQVR